MLDRATGRLLPSCCRRVPPLRLPSRRLPPIASQPIVLLLTQIILGDIDNDGDLDAVVFSKTQNNVFWNDGSGSFTPDGAFDRPNVMYNLYANTVVAGLADLDNDGDVR